MIFRLDIIFSSVVESVTKSQIRLETKMYNSHKIKILFIGDSFDKVSDISHRLDGLGYDVLFALGGPAGLRAAGLEQPDAVICDLGLYDMKGLNVCREIRNDPKIAETCFIFLTKSFHNKECIAAAFTAGADDCLPEDSNVEIISAKLNWLIERKRQDLARNERYQILKSRQMQIADIFRSISLSNTLTVAPAVPVCDAVLAENRISGIAASAVISSLAGLLDEQIKTLDSLEIEQPSFLKFSFNNPINHTSTIDNEILLNEMVM